MRTLTSIHRHWPVAVAVAFVMVVVSFVDLCHYEWIGMVSLHTIVVADSISACKPSERCAHLVLHTVVIRLLKCVNLSTVDPNKLIFVLPKSVN